MTRSSYKTRPGEPMAGTIRAAIWCQAKDLGVDTLDLHALVFRVTGKTSLAADAVPRMTNADGLLVLRALDRERKKVHSTNAEPGPGAGQARVTHLLSSAQLGLICELAESLGWPIRRIEYPDGTARVEIPSLQALLDGRKSPAPGVRDLYHLRRGREAPRVIEALKSLVRQAARAATACLVAAALVG